MFRLISWLASRFVPTHRTFTSFVRVFTHVDTCDLKHSRQRRSPSRTQSPRLRAPPVRARSLATPLPSLRSSDSQRPVPCLESPVLRFLHASVCPPLLFRIQSRGRPLLSSAQRKTPSDLDAAMHGPPQSSSCLHAKATPADGAHVHMAAFDLTCGEARKLRR